MLTADIAQSKDRLKLGQKRLTGRFAIISRMSPSPGNTRPQRVVDCKPADGSNADQIADPSNSLRLKRDMS